MKRAIIIGATSGIGKELALLLIKKNYLVGITGRRKELLDKLHQQSLGNFIVSNFDISQTSSIGGELNSLVEQLGGLDLLILCSGYGDLNPKLNTDIELETVNTNVNGFTTIACWAHNYFITQDYGHFAAISSIAGLRGGRLAPAYNASKAFQINYLEALRQNLNKKFKKIYITDIRPGFVETAMAKGDKKFWVATPQKAAQQILSAIHKKKKVVYVTKRWELIAILLKIIPRSIYEKL